MACRRVEMLELEEVPMQDIDYTDSFFHSFRVFYPEFDEWYRRQASRGRKAYIHRGPEGFLDGFLCLKIEGPEEDFSSYEILFRPATYMKICSLKVTAHGKGLGRILISAALQKARESKCDGIYVTVYPGTKETDALIRRLEECGFLYHGHRVSEEVYARNV